METERTHLALPSHVPPLGHLSGEELRDLRGHLQKQLKLSRAEVTKLLGSRADKKVKDLWVATLGLRCSDETRREFEAEILRYPEAFVRYAYTNSLAIMDQIVYAEVLHRSKMK